MDRDFGTKVRIIEGKVSFKLFFIIILIGLILITGEPFRDIFNHFRISLDYLYFGATLLTFGCLVWAYREVKNKKIIVYTKGLSGYPSLGKGPNFLNWGKIKKFHVSNDPRSPALYIYDGEVPIIYINFLVFDPKVIIKSIEPVTGSEHPILDELRKYANVRPQ